MDPNDKKTKINWFYPHSQKKKEKKMVLFKENRYWFNLRRLVLVYNYFEFDNKSSSYCYNVFLLIF